MSDRDVAHLREQADTAGNGLNAVDPVGTNGSPAADFARWRREMATRVDEVAAGFSRTTESLRHAADTLGEHGVPPGYELVHALGECHRQLLRLRLDVTRRAGELGLAVPSLDKIAGLGDLARLIEGLAPVEVLAPPAAVPVPLPEPLPEPVVLPEPAVSSPPPPAESIESVQADAPPGESSFATEAGGPTEAFPVAAGPVEPAVEVTPPPYEETPEPVLAPADDSVRRSALIVLDRALTLSTRDAGLAPPLAECLDRFRSLRQEVASAPADRLPAESEALARGEHPLNGLLNIVAGVEGLSDAQWAALHGQVTETFGRQLAVAAARGRIALGD